MHNVRNVDHCNWWSRSLVCQSIMQLHCAKLAEWIEVLFWVGPKAHCIRLGSRSISGKGEGSNGKYCLL